MARYTGTVSVSPDPVPFGGTATIEYTSTHDKPWARVTCYEQASGSVGMVTYVRLWAGETTFVAGPTPSWSGGPAKGFVELVYWNTKTSRFSNIASSGFAVE